MMILYVLISCLLILLVLRFLHLGTSRANVKVAATNFGNQKRDPLIIQKEKECLIIVTDPVGTLHHGEAACLIANQIISRLYEVSVANVSPADFLKKACFLAHRGISEHMNANSGGCSLALLYINGKQLNYASIGDIGIYLCDNELKQVNQFDLYKYQLRNQVLMRKINEDRLLNNRLRNELTAYLGHENLKKVNLNNKPIALIKSEKLFVATKAVYDVTTLLELESIIKQKGSPTNKIEVLEEVYHKQKLAKERKQHTASAVIVSHFR